MIKNKKLLFLSAVISVAPIMIVASCSNNTPTENPKDPIDPVQPPFQPVEPPRPPLNPPAPKPIDPSKIDDSIKAMANVKLLLAQETYSRIKSLLPDEKLLNDQRLFPYLEPKRNFNFQTTYNFVEKDIDNAEMKIEIVLKRGKQEVKEIITIDGFLEKYMYHDDFTNPEKVLNLPPTYSNGVFKLQPLQGSWRPEPGEPGGPGGHFPFPFPQNSDSFRILQESRKSLLKNPNDPSMDLIWIMPDRGYEENPIRWKNNFGLETNVGRINFRLVKKENPKIRSRVLVGEVELRYENNNSSDQKNAAWYAFNTFYTPVNSNASNIKASEINSQEKLLSVLNLKTNSKDIPEAVKSFYSKIDLGGFFYKPELANDQEGSLIVPLKILENGNWGEKLFIKLYGFKIDPDA